MELLLISQPPEAVFSRNNIRYTLGVAPYGQQQQALGYQVIVRVEVEVQWNTGVYIEVDSAIIYPDASGLVQLDVAERVDAYLQYFTPPPNLQSITECTEQSKRFRIRYSLANNSVVLVPPQTSTPRVAIKGGTPDRFTYPEQLITEGNFLLTNAYQPGTRTDLLQPGETRFVYMLSRTAFTPSGPTTTARLQALGYDVANDATYQYPESQSPMQRWRVYCFPVSATLFSPALVKPRAIRFDAVPVGGELLTMTVDYRPGYEYRQLLYRNSLGGLDTLSLRGDWGPEFEYERTQASLVNFPDRYVERRLKAAVVTLRPMETETIKANTGFVPRWKLDALRDLLLSDEVYELQEGRLVPVNVLTNRVQLFRKDDTLFALQLEYQFANPARSYTNAPGQAPACPLPQGFTVRQAGSGHLDIMWSLLPQYDRIDVEIQIDTEISQISFTGNSGRRRVVFSNPATGNTSATIIIRGRTVCDPLSNPISVSGWRSVNLQVVANQAPVAIDDVFNIAAGYSSAVTLTGSVLANDFDPDNDALQVQVQTNQPTNAGGTFSIAADGIISYTPPSQAYVGQDYFDYTVEEAGGGLTATARVFVNVGTGSQGGFVYVRLEETDQYSNSNGYVGNAGGTRRARFYANPAGTQAINPAALNLTLNMRKTEFYRDNQGNEQTFDEDYTVAATSGDVIIYSGEWTNFNMDPFFPFEQLFTLTHTILPGNGYIVI